MLALLCMSTVLRAQTYEQYVERALAAVEADSLVEAEVLFRSALKTAPDDYRNALIYMNLGRIQESSGKRMDALRWYTMAVDMYPESLPFVEARAGLYLDLGNEGKALLDYDHIIDIDPEHVDAHACRGYIYYRRREYDKALKDYEFVVSHVPDHYRGGLGLAITLDCIGKTAEAMDRISRLIGVYADRAELYAVRADMEARGGHTDMALLDWDKAVELAPDNAQYVLARGCLHYTAGNDRMSRRDWDKAVELGVPRGRIKEIVKGLK